MKISKNSERLFIPFRINSKELSVYPMLIEGKLYFDVYDGIGVRRFPINRTSNRSSINELKSMGIWEDVEDVFLITILLRHTLVNPKRFIKVCSATTPFGVVSNYTLVGTSSNLCNFTFITINGENRGLFFNWADRSRLLV